MLHYPKSLNVRLTLKKIKIPTCLLTETFSLDTYQSTELYKYSTLSRLLKKALEPPLPNLHHKILLFPCEILTSCLKIHGTASANQPSYISIIIAVFALGIFYGLIQQPMMAQNLKQTQKI